MSYFMAQMKINPDTYIGDTGITLKQLISENESMKEEINRLKTKTNLVASKKFEGNSVTISNLDINRDGGIYDIVFYAFSTNQDFTNPDVYCRINNKTTEIYSSIRSFERNDNIMATGNGRDTLNHRNYHRNCWIIGDLNQRGLYRGTICLLPEGISNVKCPRMNGQFGCCDDYGPSIVNSACYIGEQQSNITSIQFFANKLNSGQVFIYKRDQK